MSDLCSSLYLHQVVSNCIRPNQMVSSGVILCGVQEVLSECGSCQGTVLSQQWLVRQFLGQLRREI